MDKYKTICAFNKWFSSIKLKKLPLEVQEKIVQTERYTKKFHFESFLKVFLYGIDQERESLRELDTAFVSKNLQRTMELESISHSQLSRVLRQTDPEILWAIFTQLLDPVTGSSAGKERPLFEKSFVSRGFFHLFFEQDALSLGSLSKDQSGNQTSFEALFHG